MSDNTLLTEDQRRLMGLRPKHFGGVPVMFQRGQFEEASAAPAPAEPQSAVTEGRMTLYRDEETMKRALGRANEIIARVNASLRKRSSAEMKERERTAVERVERKLGTAMDALEGAQRALNAMCKGKKHEEREQAEAAKPAELVEDFAYKVLQRLIGQQSYTPSYQEPPMEIKPSQIGAAEKVVSKKVDGKPIGHVVVQLMIPRGMHPHAVGRIEVPPKLEKIRDQLANRAAEWEYMGGARYIELESKDLRNAEAFAKQANTDLKIVVKANHLLSPEKLRSVKL